MSLPVPTDPAFSYEPDAEEFFNPQGQEDDALLATGAFDDYAADEQPAAKPPRKVHVHVHRQ